MIVSLRKSAEKVLVMTVDELPGITWIIRDPEAWVPGDERERLMKALLVNAGNPAMPEAKQWQVNQRLEIQESRIP